MISLSGLSCKEEYLPIVIANQNNFLVVDGFINISGDSTVIRLTRTRNLNSDSTVTPEPRAKVSVLYNTSDSYNLRDIGNGSYVATGLILNNGQQCRLKIITSSGTEYLSDVIVASKTPLIDSISWRSDEEGVHVFANTHDAQAKTRFYQWEYEETWEYKMPYESELKYVNHQLVPRDSAERFYTCWKQFISRQFILGSSQKLSEDIIYEYPLVLIPSATQRLGERYSILVKQNALTREAFEYWETFSRMTEQLGSIFDVQPSQLTGNIKCLTNPQEPVIGFISAYQVEKKRIFIDKAELPLWDYRRVPYGCPIYEVSTHPDSLEFYFGTGNLIPIAIDHGVPGTTIECLDCRLSGGATKKPSFW